LYVYEAVFGVLTTLENLENSGNFFNSGKLRENPGNFKFIQGIFVSVIVGIEYCAILSVTIA